jgi:hypothetical protein
MQILQSAHLSEVANMMEISLIIAKAAEIAFVKKC